MSRLRGSGTVPRVFALAVLAIVTVFVAVWVSGDPDVLIGALVIEALAVATAVRSMFVGVLLDGDGVRVRGWFRDHRYGPGDLTKVAAIPYWRFLDAKDPILSLLKFTPAEGWVREISATVSWRDRTEAQAAEIRRHLGIGGDPGVTTNDDAAKRARAVIPGGVNSPVRAFGSVGGTPRSIVSARGATVTDVEGREYVDLVMSWGPALLGHAHPDVVDAVRTAAARGLSFGAPTPGETELAELVRERLFVEGVRGIEKLRLVSTGTEATMTAIRLARGATGRDLLIKFSGHYHGHSDGLLAESGSGVATLGLPGSAGIPAPVAAQTLVLPYNDLDAVRAAFAAHPDRIAAIITEAAGANAGVLAPVRGFNRALAGIARENGALLILDEVLTGFRVGPAGWWGLEARTVVPDGAGWIPDLVTFGKVLGGGMPLAALGGRADILNLLAPAGPVYQAGTLSGNPVAVAAGIATLRLATPNVYAHVDRAADRLAAELSAALGAEGVAHVISRAGNLFSLAFRAEPIRDYDDARAQESWRYPPFFHAMLDAGVSLPPSVFEAWFLSAAHDDATLDRVIAALPAAAKAAAAATA